MIHTQHESPPMSDERNKIDSFDRMAPARYYGIWRNKIQFVSKATLDHHQTVSHNVWNVKNEIKLVISWIKSMLASQLLHGNRLLTEH